MLHALPGQATFCRQTRLAVQELPGLPGAGPAKRDASHPSSASQAATPPPVLNTTRCELACFGLILLHQAGPTGMGHTDTERHQ